MFGSTIRLVSCAVLFVTLVVSSFATPCTSTSAFVSSCAPSRSMGTTADCSQRVSIPSPSVTITKRKPWSVLCADTGGSGPAVLDRPETVQKKDVKKEDDVEEEQKNGSDAWEVRLYNDPMNKREFVARCLAEICGMSDGESYQ
eukprot:14779387-Ditylum_brightwellii.AAC.1